MGSGVRGWNGACWAQEGRLGCRRSAGRGWQHTSGHSLQGVMGSLWLLCANPYRGLTKGQEVGHRRAEVQHTVH